MATETQQVVQNSAVAGSSATDTTGSTSGAIPTATPVVAPRGFRQVLQDMLQGWQTVVPVGSTMQSSSGGLSQAAVLETLQGYVKGYTTLDAQVTELTQVRAQVKSASAEAHQYIDVLKRALINFYGPASPQLVQFGLQPKKARKPMSSETLAGRAAKAKATRVLRGTGKARPKSGPLAMQIVSAGQSVQQGTTAASTAPAEASASAVSSPSK
jgi:hypothetical protein